ncbi:hypothetical protein ABW21_db0200085 [Orbilia brochopaga]|nr:hypothetical protein ABW21_db0200085 [Drechslerella brochopaga]
MGRVRSQKTKNSVSFSNFNKNKKGSKGGSAKASSSTPSGCPNLVLLGFKQGLHFKNIYKMFQRHGIMDHGKIAQQLQEQWGSCPKYTNKLNRYWWNLQDEQRAHFAMLKRNGRKTREQLKAIEDEAAGDETTKNSDLAGGPTDHLKIKSERKTKNLFTFKFNSNNAKMSNVVAWKGHSKLSTAPKCQVAPRNEGFENLEGYERNATVNLHTLVTKAMAGKSVGTRTSDEGAAGQDTTEEA